MAYFPGRTNLDVHFFNDTPRSLKVGKAIAPNARLPLTLRHAFRSKQGCLLVETEQFGNSLNADFVKAHVRSRLGRDTGVLEHGFLTSEVDPLSSRGLLFHLGQLPPFASLNSRCS